LFFTLTKQRREEQTACFLPGTRSQIKPKIFRMSSSLTRGHVLIAEDNRDLSRIMSHLLKLAGYDVVTVHDGRDAVEAACALLPEIVLLDIGLPGLDGFRVAERLRGEAGLRALVIIAISGYDADMYPGRSQRAGFDHHLVKPVDIDALLPLLGTQLSDRAV
jgi:CheY-like chemotaxis protein